MAIPLLILAAYQVVQGMQQADLIGKQAALTNRINRLNAKYAELDAYNAEKQGYTEAARYQANIDDIIGQQRVGYATQNVDVSSGTAAAVQAESRVNGLLNVIDIQARARRQAMGYKVEASNRRLGADFASSQAAIDQSVAQSRGIGAAAETGLSYYSRYGAKLGSSSSNGSGINDSTNVSGANSGDRLVSDGTYYGGATRYSFA